MCLLGRGHTHTLALIQKRADGSPFTVIVTARPLYGPMTLGRVQQKREIENTDLT